MKEVIKKELRFTLFDWFILFGGILIIVVQAFGYNPDNPLPNLVGALIGVYAIYTRWRKYQKIRTERNRIMKIGRMVVDRWVKYHETSEDLLTEGAKIRLKEIKKELEEEYNKLSPEDKAKVDAISNNPFKKPK